MNPPEIKGILPAHDREYYNSLPDYGTVVSRALSERVTDPEGFIALSEQRDVLHSSTDFRGEILFPGECVTLRYEQETEGGELSFGYLGFDENGGLISIDPRNEGGNALYRNSAGEWVSPFENGVIKAPQAR